MAETPSHSKPTAPEPDPKFDVEDIVEHRIARLGSDYSAHAIRGALSGERRKHFTAVEAKKLVDAWLDKRVEGQPEEDDEA